ncbi:MAG: flagellar biosynthesis repressor FlbT [Deltaproteobacteria bacterium]|nr:flagellar biosynthesis repressor FlbT [Deltaproteobacteria bacterium]
MTLKITLKPNEKMIIGGAVITNGNIKNIDLIIENNLPVLRQKDILSEKDATSPCSRIYFLIQLMYIDEENLATHQHTYWKLVRELLDAAPRLTGHIDLINEHILSGNCYRALKLASELIHYEQEVLRYADADSIITGL